ncbi:MAG: hypothetical protein ABW168_22075 [Sedimenticola sp.]
MKRGHKVLVALRDISAGEKYLSPLGVDIIQAPIWSGRLRKKVPPAINYAELLMQVGYLNVDQVTGQIRSWLTLLDMVKPDLILGDHSPSVLLAARIAKVNAGTLGPGFASPPVLPMMPSIQPNADFPDARFISTEIELLNIINKALIRCGGESLRYLSQIFDTTHNYLLTYPETDHYGVRRGVRYWGLVQSSRSADEPLWPTLEGPKVYVYMQPNARSYDRLLDSLKQLDWPCLIISRNIKQQQIESLTAPNLAFSPVLVNLESVARKADIVVTNCNHGTVIELLQRGCKQLVIPLQTEQSMLAHRLASQGLVIAKGAGSPSYIKPLKEVLYNQILRANVDKFKNQYKKHNPESQLTLLADDICRRIVNNLPT